MITEAKIRKSLPTPPFFLKVKRIGGQAAVIGGLIVTAAASLASVGIALPAFIAVAGGALATIGGTAYKLADFAVTDPNELDKLMAEQIVKQNTNAK